MFFNWEAERRILRKIYVLVIDFNVLYDCDEMKISACPKCGSKRITMGTMGAGVTFGITSWKSVCKDCGYQGEPIIFDSAKEYERFLREINEEPDNKKKSGSEKKKSIYGRNDVEPLELSKKEKEVLEFLNELSKEKFKQKIQRQDKGKDKNWWPEIILAFFLSAVSVVGSTLGMPSFYGNFGIVFSVLFFVPLALLYLMSIVIIEYLYNRIRKILTKNNN